uniref:ShKT domain-containing protein n=1 Tax=Strongyloides stercoralis TaxID=6248 RepID=A0A0K0EIR7_STRER
MNFYIFFVFLFILLADYVNGSCQSMADGGYCDNPLYKRIMCKNCPKECSKECVVPKPDKSCKDIASNCDSMKNLCNNPTYKPLMHKNCPSTCGTCPGKTTAKPTAQPSQNTTEPVTANPILVTTTK